MTGSGPATVSVRIVGGILAAGRSRDVDVEPALAAAGIQASQLEDPDARIPIEREEALWDEMVRRTGDVCFGLHAQSRIPPGTLDVLDYIVRSSADLRAAWLSLVRYNRIVHDRAEFELVEAGEGARLVQRFRGDPRGGHPQVTDYSLGGLVTVTRQLVGDDWTPLGVQMTRPAPPDAEPYRAHFRVEPAFGCAANVLEVPVSLLDRAISGADPMLHDVLRRHCESLIERLPRAEGVLESARDWLARRVCGGDCGVEAMAAELGMTARTLQRHLARAGTSHQAMLEQMRGEMARELLDDARVSVADVAFVLGYSEPSAFHRAFKRWTGETPAGYRGRQRAGSGRL